MSKKQVTNKQGSELADDTLEQLNGGAFELKKEDSTLKVDGGHDDWILTGPQPTSRPGG